MSTNNRETDQDTDIETVRESVLVLSEINSEDDEVERTAAKMNLERVSNRLERESPLKTLIESFKMKYNISIEPNGVAIFV